GCVGAAGAARQGDRLAHVATGAEAEDGLGLAADGDEDWHLDRRTRVQPRAETTRQPLPLQGDRRLHAAVAAEELDAVRGQAAPLVADAMGVGVEERHPASELGVVGIARGEYPAVAVDLADHMHPRPGAEVAEHPFHVARGRQAPWPAGPVAQAQDAVLHRLLEIDVDPQLAGDAVLDMLEDA